MPSKIDPSALSPHLPRAWDAPENKTHPSAGDIDHLLQRPIAKPAWQNASQAPMTLDPVTRKPMVDPVLCSDGKLHDRTTVRALPYLDTHDTAKRNLRVLGRDLEARASVHEAFPLARTMLRNRSDLTDHIAKARAAQAPASEPSANAATQTIPEQTLPTPRPLTQDEQDALVFRRYQMRTRSGTVTFHGNQGLARTQGRVQPLSFSRNTFTRFGVLAEETGWRGALKHVVATPSQRLVDHLVDHKVLQGRGKTVRMLGCIEFLESALDSFKIGKRALTDAEKAGARKYVQFFARLSRQIAKPAAELEHSYNLFETNENYRNLTTSQQQLTTGEATSLHDYSQHMILHIHTLARGMLRSTERKEDTGLSRPVNMPAPKRTQSLQNLRLTQDLEALDADVFYCPVLLEPAPAPVLFSDGHSYDLSQFLEGNLTKSPLTRENMHVIGRHEEKQSYASAVVGKQDLEYFEGTYEGLRDAYQPRKGGFEDQLVIYQRRRRNMSRQAFPDRFSEHVFQKFGGLSARDSATLVTALSRHGLINRGVDRRIAPNTSKATIRGTMSKCITDFDKLKTSRKSDITRVVNVLYQEQTRRFPLVAQARHLAGQLSRLPKDMPRYAEVKAELEHIDRELHKLPSGADGGSKLTLY